MLIGAQMAIDVRFWRESLKRSKASPSDTSSQENRKPPAFAEGK